MTDAEKIKELEAQLTGLYGNIARLLNQVGEPADCRGCKARIWFVFHPKTSKHAPYTASALNHYADCPAADKFRK